VFPLSLNQRGRQSNHRSSSALVEVQHFERASDDGCSYFLRELGGRYVRKVNDDIPASHESASTSGQVGADGCRIDPAKPAMRRWLLLLESTKAPVDVVVIDHVEKPTSD
jgi:hypothetical protein